MSYKTHEELNKSYDELKERHDELKERHDRLVKLYHILDGRQAKLQAQLGDVENYNDKKFYSNITAVICLTCVVITTIITVGASI